MVKVCFTDRSGQQRILEGRVGNSLMLVAVQNDISGIDAECGGACACATCHVYVPEPWFSKLPKADVMESDMLDFARNVQPNSRLACQIKLTEALDGLCVEVGR
jgi:2Fe-2S ferredoxin